MSKIIVNMYAPS